MATHDVLCDILTAEILIFVFQFHSGTQKSSEEDIIDVDVWDQTAISVMAAMSEWLLVKFLLFNMQIKASFKSERISMVSQHAMLLQQGCMLRAAL